MAAALIPAPRSVRAAVLATQICSAMVAGIVALYLVLALVFLGPFFDVFDADLRWWVFGSGAALLLLSGLAFWAAFGLQRGEPWSRWLLVVLSVVTCVLGLAGSYYVFPLLTTATAVAVLVLLFRAESRSWFRSVQA